MTVSICHHCGGLGPRTAYVAIGISRQKKGWGGGGRGGAHGTVTSVKSQMWRSLCFGPDYTRLEVLVAQIFIFSHRTVSLLHC